MGSGGELLITEKLSELSVPLPVLCVESSKHKFNAEGAEKAAENGEMKVCVLKK